MSNYGTHAVIISPAAQLRLKKIAEEQGRKIEDLIATAAEESALDYFRYRRDDPVKDIMGNER